MKFTFPVSFEQKRSALHYMTALAEEEKQLSEHLSDPSRTELLLALNYILDLIIDDVLRSVRDAK